MRLRVGSGGRCIWEITAGPWIGLIQVQPPADPTVSENASHSCCLNHCSTSLPCQSPKDTNRHPLIRPGLLWIPGALWEQRGLCQHVPPTLRAAPESPQGSGDPSRMKNPGMNIFVREVLGGLGMLGFYKAFASM